jgi:PAS domain S-box-containing protein
MPSEHEPGFGAKLRAVFGLSPTILCLTGLEDGRVRDVNDSFLHATGFTREEVIGRPMAELGLWLNPEDRAAGLRKLRAGEAIRGLEARFRMKSGEERVTVVAADVVTIDGEACVLTALTDITDRKRMEESLRESERRFMTAFHANPLPMSITALSDHRQLEVNEAAVRHSGYSREELLGRSKRELGFWAAPEQLEGVLRLLHERGQVRDLEVTFRTRAGDLRQLLVNSEVISYDGAPAVLSVSLDITERKQLEAESRARRDEAEALAQTLRQANRAKDEFLAMLGHELRNPLGTLTNAVAVQQDRGR